MCEIAKFFAAKNFDGKLSGFEEIRPIGNKGFAHELRMFKPISQINQEDIAKIKTASADSTREINVYAGVNPRSVKGGTKNDITQMWFVHCEIDNMDAEAAISKLAEINIIPTIVVRSSLKNCHVYIRLTEPFDVTTDEAKDIGKNLNARMNIFFGINPDNATDISRILRVPSTPNYPSESKKKSGRTTEPTSLAFTSTTSYTFEHISSLLPALPIAAKTVSTEPVVIPDISNSEKMQQAVSYLIKKNLDELADKNSKPREGLGQRNFDDITKIMNGFNLTPAEAILCVKTVLQRYDKFTLGYDLNEDEDIWASKVQYNPIPSGCLLQDNAKTLQMLVDGHNDAVDDDRIQKLIEEHIKEKEKSNTKPISDWLKEIDFTKPEPRFYFKEYPTLSNLSSGWSYGCLYSVAGYTGMYKSTFAENIIRSIAASGEKAVLLSFENQAKATIKKIMAQMSGIPYYHLDECKFTPSEVVQLQKSLETFSKYPLYLNNENNKIEDILNEIDSYSEKGVKFFVVDQLSWVKGEKCQSIKDEYNLITKTLSSKAKQLNVIIMLLCQINRSGAMSASEGKLINLFNLKDCSGIEENSAGVIIIQRIERDDKGKPLALHVTISKNRSGNGNPEDLIKFGIVPETCLITDLGAGSVSHIKQADCTEDMVLDVFKTTPSISLKDLKDLIHLNHKVSKEKIDTFVKSMIILKMKIKFNGKNGNQKRIELIDPPTNPVTPQGANPTLCIP